MNFKFISNYSNLTNKVFVISQKNKKLNINLYKIKKINKIKKEENNKKKEVKNIELLI